MQDNDQRQRRGVRGKGEARVVKVDAPSRLIQPADSVPRVRPSWLRADQHNGAAPKSMRRSTAEILKAKGVAKRFWPPMGKGGEPVVKWLGRSGVNKNLVRLEATA